MRGNQPRERLMQAKAATQRAIDLEPDLVEAWDLLTSILFYREWDMSGAEAACRRAIEQSIPGVLRHASDTSTYCVFRVALRKRDSKSTVRSSCSRRRLPFGFAAPSCCIRRVTLNKLSTRRKLQRR